MKVDDIDELIAKQEDFRLPKFIIARKKKYYWVIRDKIFDF